MKVENEKTMKCKFFILSSAWVIQPKSLLYQSMDDRNKSCPNELEEVGMEGGES